MLVVSLALCVTGCTPSFESSRRARTTEIAGRLDRAFETAVRAAGFPGVQAAVVYGDGRVWTGSSGFADVEERLPVRDDTLFAAGSITKTFVAALTLDLVEQGLLGLDDDASRWLPRLRSARGVTVRQLLSHTSGWADPFETAPFDRPDREWTPRQVLARMGRPHCEPGTCWRYSNANYIALGLVIEEATGSPVSSQLDEFLSPLGLENIFLQGDVEPAGEVARGYERPGAVVEEISAGIGHAPHLAFASAAWTSGGIAATAEDVARFVTALFTAELLEGASVDAMTDGRAYVLPGGHPCLRYGLGVHVGTDLGGHAVWGHSGFVPGFRSEMAHFPGGPASVVVFANFAPDGPAEIAEALGIVLREEGLLTGGLPGYCNTDLYAKEIGTGATTRLTEARAFDGATISFSPAEDRLAFGSVRGGIPDIHLLDMADGTTEVVTPGGGWDRGASWSPNGPLLAFQNASDGDDEIYLLELETGERRRLTDNEVPDTVPVWSPDGRSIAFSRGVRGDRDVWVLEVASGQESRLTSSLADQWWPAWSPDGSEIAFMNETDGEIEVVERHGFGYRRLTEDAVFDGFPAWSPGKEIAFMREGDIWTMKGDGSRRRRITRTPFREFGPSWSPDGRLLVFGSERPNP